MENYIVNVVKMKLQEYNTRIKMEYKTIVEAIYKKAKINNIDVRILIRNWINVFEDSRVSDWNRDAFMCECIQQEKKNG